jgi:hypothetical protein
MSKSWVRDALTDDRGEFDVANIMVALGVQGILLIAGWDVAMNKHEFKPLETGGGCAALVAALWASKKGDAAVRTNGTA